MAVIQPRPTHILYQCAKFGDDRTSFNVIFDVKGLYPYFGILFLSYYRDIDLKCIQDTYRVVINSPKNIDVHRSTVKVTGMVHCSQGWYIAHKN